MSRPINIQSAITVNVSSYSGYTGSVSISNQNSGINSSANTSNYATITPSTSASSGYVIYRFDTSEIPSNATINSVYCAARGRASNNNRVRSSFQLFAANTAKGSPVFFTSNTSTAYTLTTGTWNYNEIQDVRLRVGSIRTSTSNTGSTRFYGATLTVNYTISGVEYEVTASSEYDGASVSPASQFIFQGGDAVVRIDTDTLDNMVLEDNGSDVTENLQYIIPQDGTQSFTGCPTSFDPVNTNVEVNNTSGSGLTVATSSARAYFLSNSEAYSESNIYYNFDCSSIPEDAIIESVTCETRAAASSAYFETRIVQLCAGTTKKGSPTQIRNSSINDGTIYTLSIDGGNSWTRGELNNLKILIQAIRGSSTNTFNISFYGASLTIQYSLPQTPYYQYTISNISADHDIVFKEAIIVPPEEDPDIEYHSITISSINAATEPGRGTTRVESGTNETITIYPSDPQLTLATDNGVDITSQLVAHGGTIQDPTVTTANGASYGFTLNSSTGYYTSANEGVNKSAAVCRVSFNLPVRCLVTINYINYAEATYDFGVFGNIDTALNTNYYAAGSGGATITDNDYKLACRTSSYNTSSVQTITYEIPSGEHYIDIKYSKDDATSSNNDTLQWKIASIEPLENNNYYTYNLNGINSDHSLVFIFGNVTYYFVNSSTDSESARLYPQGSMVYLPGDDYKLTVVPQNDTDSVSVYDNGTDVSGSLERKEITTVKDGISSTTVNYNYYLYNIQATHNISVSVTPMGSAFLKSNGSWTKVTVYKKINGEWELQRIEDDIFDDGIIYISN